MNNQLLQNVIAETQLPKDIISNELIKLINKSNYNVEDLTMNQLREVLADYLQDVFVELMDHSQETTPESR